MLFHKIKEHFLPCRPSFLFLISAHVTIIVPHFITKSIEFCLCRWWFLT
jgi:hypothetical protein